MQEAPLMLKNKTARRIKDIPGFVFPGGVKVIINFTVDFDAMIFRKFLREPKLWCAQGEFGGRTGLWRLLDVFGEFDVRTTLFLPGRRGSYIRKCSGAPCGKGTKSPITCGITTSPRRLRRRPSTWTGRIRSSRG